MQSYKVQKILAYPLDFAYFFIRLYEGARDLLFAAAENFRRGHTILGFALEKIFEVVRIRAEE